MTASHELLITTRFSDLDSQRHINNSFYEIYTREARYLILQQFGYDYARCVAEELYIKPLASEVTFHRQQNPFTQLKIITHYKQDQKGVFHWHHKIQNNEDGSIACEIEHYTLFEKQKTPFVLSIPEVETSIDTFPTQNAIPEFSQNCKRSILKIVPRHIEMDGFKKYPMPVLWRYNEEARWKFFKDTGLPFQKIKAKDRAFFWVHGQYNYGLPVELHNEITIYTWVHLMEGARIYIRQYTENSNTGEKIMDVQGEFVTVALSRSRPVRIPDFVHDAFINYTENMVIQDDEN